MDRAVPQGIGSNVAERIKPIAQVAVTSAETQLESVKTAAATPSAGPNGQQVYQTTCVACHEAGIAGAPKLGNKAQWAKHVAKGLNTPYPTALNGVQGTAVAMPAKGGNPALANAAVT